MKKEPQPQIHCAIRWCIKYNMPINTRCAQLDLVMDNLGKK